MKNEKNCSCEGVRYNWIERPVRRFVQLLHKKGICTNSSEGGGNRRHGAPDFAYVETYLNKKNLSRAKKEGFLLDMIYGRGGSLFYGSAVQCGRESGFYVIGICRKGLSDQQTEKKLLRLLPKLSRQTKHALRRFPDRQARLFLGRT